MDTVVLTNNGRSYVMNKIDLIRMSEFVEKQFEWNPQTVKMEIPDEIDSESMNYMVDTINHSMQVYYKHFDYMGYMNTYNFFMMRNEPQFPYLFIFYDVSTGFLIQTSLYTRTYFNHADIPNMINKEIQIEGFITRVRVVHDIFRDEWIMFLYTGGDTPILEIVKQYNRPGSDEKSYNLAPVYKMAYKYHNKL